MVILKHNQLCLTICLTYSINFWVHHLPLLYQIPSPWELYCTLTDALEIGPTCHNIGKPHKNLNNILQSTVIYNFAPPSFTAFCNSAFLQMTNTVIIWPTHWLYNFPSDNFPPPEKPLGQSLKDNYQPNNSHHREFPLRQLTPTIFFRERITVRVRGIGGNYLKEKLSKLRIVQVRTVRKGDVQGGVVYWKLS